MKTYNISNSKIGKSKFLNMKDINYRPFNKVEWYKATGSTGKTIKLLGYEYSILIPAIGLLTGVGSFLFSKFYLKKGNKTSAIIGTAGLLGGLVIGGLIKKPTKIIAPSLAPQTKEEESGITFGGGGGFGQPANIPETTTSNDLQSQTPAIIPTQPAITTPDLTKIQQAVSTVTAPKTVSTNTSVLSTVTSGAFVSKLQANIELAKQCIAKGSDYVFNNGLCVKKVTELCTKPPCYHYEDEAGNIYNKDFQLQSNFSKFHDINKK